MTEFRTDNLERDQRIAALEDRVGELELMIDGLYNEVRSSALDYDEYDMQPLEEEGK